MPIVLPSFITPSSASVPFILEDIYTRGGYRVVLDVGERDALHPAKIKAGMLVYTQTEDIIWKRLNDGTWVDLFANISGGNSAYLPTAGGTMDGPLVPRTPPEDGSNPYANNEVLPKSEILSLLSTVGVPRYVHNQTTPSNLWSIPHNLNSFNLIIQVYSSSGNRLLPSNSNNVDVNTTELSYASQVSGTAYIISI